MVSEELYTQRGSDIKPPAFGFNRISSSSAVGAEKTSESSGHLAVVQTGGQGYYSISRWERSPTNSEAVTSTSFPCIESNMPLKKRIRGGMEQFRIPGFPQPQFTLPEFHPYPTGGMEVSNGDHLLPSPSGTGSPDFGPHRREGTDDSNGINDVRKMEHMAELTPKKQKYRTSRPPLLPPCRVCMDQASGYHYGVNTCEACKGFFRRSIMKKQSHACVGEGGCSTIKGMRTACAACRFQKCLEVGMSKDAIKTGRYTHELRSKNIREVKNLKLQQSHIGDKTNGSLMTSQSVVSPMKSSSTSRDIIDLDKVLETIVDGQKLLFEYLDDYFNEELLLERQIHVYNRYLGEKMLPSQLAHVTANELSSAEQSSRSSIQKSRLNESRSAYNDSASSPQESRGSCLSGVCKELGRGDFTKGHEKHAYTLNDTYHYTNVDRNPQLKTNDTKSREILETYAADKALSTCAAISPEHSPQKSEDSVCDIKKETVDNVSEEEKGKEVMMQILTDMEKSVLGILSFARCLPGFKNLPKEDQASLVKAARFDVWYIGHIRCFNTELRVGACEWQFHADELSQVWGKDVVDLAFRVSKQGQQLRLTKEETACLRAVSLSFSDRCYPLTDRDAVEHLHSNMLEMFKHTASRRNKNFSLWFAKVISFLALLREFGIKFEKVSSNIPLDWELINRDPYLLSVFLS